MTKRGPITEAATRLGLDDRIALLPANREVDLALETLEERVRQLGAELMTRIVGFVQTADVAVVDLASCEQAVKLRQSIGALDKEAEIYFNKEDSDKVRYHKLHAAACAREKVVRKPLADLDAKIAGALRTYNDEQTRLREARDRELAEQAKRDADERAAAEAGALERSGDHQMAAAVMAEALAAPMPIVVSPNEVKQVAGLKTRPVYCWRYSGGPKDVKDTPPALLERAMKFVPREYLTVDEKKVGAYARAMKGAAKVPGLEFYTVNEPIR